MQETIQQISRRERERNLRRQEILEAARHVFATKGYKDAKLEDVAERAEFGKGTLYNYFENKEALFQSVLQDSFARMLSIAEDALKSDLTFEEKISRFIQGILTYFFNNVESVQLMLSESHQLRGSNPLMQLMPKLLGMLADTIAAEQRRRKVIASLEPTGLAAILLHMIIGQFMIRVYRCHQGESDAAPTGEDFCLPQLIAGRTPEEIAREIKTAASLIQTVYFTGITR